MNDTFYYGLMNNGVITRPFNSMDDVQYYISESGVPHHFINVVAVQFRKGVIRDTVGTPTLYPVWFEHWRKLELVKRNKTNDTD